eukprot:SAG11_NODE_8433_length_1016_cov_0.929117_2_plen_225_part_01
MRANVRADVDCWRRTSRRRLKDCSASTCSWRRSVPLSCNSRTTSARASRSAGTDGGRCASTTCAHDRAFRRTAERTWNSIIPIDDWTRCASDRLGRHILWQTHLEALRQQRVALTHRVLQLGRHAELHLRRLRKPMVDRTLRAPFQRVTFKKIRQQKLSEGCLSCGKDYQPCRCGVGHCSRVASLTHSASFCASPLMPRSASPLHAQMPAVVWLPPKTPTRPHTC